MLSCRTVFSTRQMAVLGSLVLSSTLLAMPTAAPALTQAVTRQGLHFEPNQGQAAPPVRFLAHGEGYMVLLTEDEAVLTMTRTDTPGGAPQALPTAPPAPAVAAARQAVLRMRLAGAAAAPSVEGEDRRPGQTNYLLGDPQSWRTDIPHFGAVRYRQVYPGIDLVYHGHGRQLEHDFIVAPQADPQVIRVEFPGAEALRLDPQGHLVLQLGHEAMLQRAPVLYQDDRGVRRAIEGGYVVRGAQEVGFWVGTYDRTQPLVIDPIIMLNSTYVGGSGFENGSGSGARHSMTVDAAGNIYLTGTTDSANFGTAWLPFNPPFAPPPTVLVNTHVYVAKLNAAGVVQYLTFVGGNGGDDGQAIAVNALQQAYVTGYTLSNPFLGLGCPPNVNAFVFKLNAAGNFPLFQGCIGGAGADFGTDIALDAVGNMYITGYTDGLIPIVSGCQPTPGGSFDTFVIKMSPIGVFLYSTYFGGSGVDYGQAIAVNALQQAYVTGTTNTLFSPLSGPGGAFDGFIARFSTTLAGAASCGGRRRFGGTDNESIHDIAVQPNGVAYVTGASASSNFPTTGGVIQPNDPTPGGVSSHYDAVIVKFSSNPVLGLMRSTYFNGPPLVPGGMGLLCGPAEGAAGSISLANGSHRPPGSRRRHYHSSQLDRGVRRTPLPQG